MSATIIPQSGEDKHQTVTPRDVKMDQNMNYHQISSGPSRRTPSHIPQCRCQQLHQVHRPTNKIRQSKPAGWFYGPSYPFISINSHVRNLATNFAFSSTVSASATLCLSIKSNKFPFFISDARKPPPSTLIQRKSNVPMGETLGIHDSELKAFKIQRCDRIESNIKQDQRPLKECVFRVCCSPHQHLTLGELRPARLTSGNFVDLMLDEIVH